MTLVKNLYPSYYILKSFKDTIFAKVIKKIGVFQIIIKKNRP